MQVASLSQLFLRQRQLQTTLADRLAERDQVLPFHWPQMEWRLRESGRLILLVPNEIGGLTLMFAEEK